MNVTLTSVLVKTSLLKITTFQNHEISNTNSSNRPRGVHETRTFGTDTHFTENMKDKTSVLKAKFKKDDDDIHGYYTRQHIERAGYRIKFIIDKP